MALILRKELNKESLMYPNNLLKTINALPGIIDISSTPLYDKRWSSFIIFFEVDIKDNTGLFFLTRCLDRRYFKYGDLWDIKLEVGDSMRNAQLPIIYHIERKREKDVHIENEIDELIENMNWHLNSKSFMDGYNLDINRFYVIDDLTELPYSSVAIKENREEKIKSII